MRVKHFDEILSKNHFYQLLGIENEMDLNRLIAAHGMLKSIISPTIGNRSGSSKSVNSSSPDSANDLNTSKFSKSSSPSLGNKLSFSFKVGQRFKLACCKWF